MIFKGQNGLKFLNPSEYFDKISTNRICIFLTVSHYFRRYIETFFWCLIFYMKCKSVHCHINVLSHFFHFWSRKFWASDVITCFPVTPYKLNWWPRNSNFSFTCWPSCIYQKKRRRRRRRIVASIRYSLSYSQTFPKLV